MKEIDLPREHRITAKPVGEAVLRSIPEDGSEINWDRDFGLHHSCSCGESFDGHRALQAQIVDHLIDVGVLDWDDVDEDVFR